MASLVRKPPIYVVTDIEADGPTPGENSMLSFASVAIGEDGLEYGTFETVLEPLSGAGWHPDTLTWFRSQPLAFAAATSNPLPVEQELERFQKWVRDLPGSAVFAAHPLLFDGQWIDFYLRRFLKTPLMAVPPQQEPLFHGAGLCIRSYAKGVLGAQTPSPNDYPAEWLGFQPHTHRAIDDARGYAHLLMTLQRRTLQST